MVKYTEFIGNTTIRRSLSLDDYDKFYMFRNPRGEEEIIPFDDSGLCTVLKYLHGSKPNGCARTAVYVFTGDKSHRVTNEGSLTYFKFKRDDDHIGTPLDKVFTINAHIRRGALAINHRPPAFKVNNLKNQGISFDAK